MQNRYVPDLGDFSKFGVIAALARPGSSGGLRVGLVWYLTNPETHHDGSFKNNDGVHRKYLHLPSPQRDRFRGCDPRLYDLLRRIDASGRHDVREYRRLLVAGPSGMVAYFEETLCLHSPVKSPGTLRQRRTDCRSAWLGRAVAAVADAELVLLDPDNGLSPSDAAATSAVGGKFATLAECARFFDPARRSLIVYQHTHRRGSAHVQITAALRRLVGHLRATPQHAFALRFHRGSSRAYLVIPARPHFTLLRDRAAAMLAGPWGACGHFTQVSL